MKRLPILLTTLRAALGPCVIVLAYAWPQPAALAACVVVAFVSDVLDGMVARRLGVATAALRRLDSIADSVFYLCALWAAWLLHPAAILDNVGLLAILAALELARYAFDAWKFHREASYHMWSSKLWGLALFAAFFALFGFGHVGVLPVVAIATGIVADIEGLLISLALPAWRHDVPTIFHALRIRGGDADDMPDDTGIAT